MIDKLPQTGPLVGRTCPQRYTRQQYIVLHGDTSGRVAELAEGVVGLSKVLCDGRRQIIGFALPGDLIGAWQYDAVQYAAVAFTPALAYVARRSDFMRRVSDDVMLMRQLQAYTMQLLTFAEEHIAVLGRGIAEEKVAWFLVRWRERWEARIGRSDTIHLPMTRQDMADYLGLTIETVSRAITRLKSDGIILPYRDRVDVLDPDRLVSLGMFVGRT